ncbi:MAG: MarR family transcriptional regulator, partial [Stenotrophomonas sp.]|nr:MarR family transcriptional regulator [Stenotrophomonas sp.]
MLETKHHAFLTELERRGQPDSGELALCFQVLSLASAIDQDCASPLAPRGQREGRLVLVLLLRGADKARSP